jgi:hypothetical protein
VEWVVMIRVGLGLLLFVGVCERLSGLLERAAVG